jgi:hypothetical protein
MKLEAIYLDFIPSITKVILNKRMFLVYSFLRAVWKSVDKSWEKQKGDWRFRCKFE